VLGVTGQTQQRPTASGQVRSAVLVGAGITVLIVGWFVAYLVGAFGLPAGMIHGWLWQPLVFVALVLPSWVFWWGHRWRHAVCLALAVVGAVAGVQLARTATPTESLVRHELDSRVTVPHHAVLIEDDAGGNFLCFDVCPWVSRLYLLTGDEEAAEAAFQVDTGDPRVDIGVHATSHDGVSFHGGVPDPPPGKTYVSVFADARQGP